MSFSTVACWFSLKYRLLSLQIREIFIIKHTSCSPTGSLIAVLLGSLPERYGLETSGEYLWRCVDHRKHRQRSGQDLTMLSLKLVGRHGAQGSCTCDLLLLSGVFCEGTFFWWFCAVVELLGSESRFLVSSHKSSLGLAHDWGRLSFVAQPQPNSSNPARSRPVCSPEPWATSGFAVGLHASGIIPFHCHRSHLFAF